MDWRFSLAARISADIREISPAADLIPWVRRLRQRGLLQEVPLASSEFTNGGSRRMGMIVLKGLQGPVTVKGQQYGTAVMQPWDKTLTDKQIADVMTYERCEWGNSACPVTPEQIAALRKALADHPNSFTAPEVLSA